MSQPVASPRSFASALVLGTILAFYVCARVLEVVSSPVPRMAIVALDVVSAMAFALTDGSRHYRLRGILVFACICTVVGNLVENLGVTTGFPFGRYYFVELMGPKLFHVPVLLGLAYIGMAYVSWALAGVIVGRPDAPIGGARLFTLPLLASAIMTAWDLAQDPVWATVLHGWVWRDGGTWFGVPVSNYFGWYANLFVIYLLFALYLRRNPARSIAASRASWRPTLIFYGLCAAGNVLQVKSTYPISALVQDPTGKLWRVADITAASALVSIFLMGGFVALAWISLMRQERTATD